MPEEETQVQARAKAFFEKARKAAGARNYDRAIDMYLEGLRFAPDAVQQGHVALRELALLRQEKGGPKPSRQEVNNRLQGKTALEQMLNAEYLLAKDPEHLPYAEAVLKAAVAGGYREAAKWIADLMFLANNNARRASLQIYLLLKDAYAAIGQLDRAVAVCQRALRLKPDNEGLAEDLRELSAKLSAAIDKDEEEDDLAEFFKDHQGPEKAQASNDVIDTEGYALAADEEIGKGDGIGTVSGNDSGQDLTKAKAFFEKGQKAAEAGSFDYAIDMYLEGLRRAPDALEEGHLPLGELALQRQGRGGKKPTMVERVKRLRGKTALEQMLNAEYLYVKDPSHLPYAEAMLKAAVAGGYERTANWIANLVFQTNNALEKPSVHTYILLKDSYKSLGKFDKAVAACQRAVRLKPEDGELAEEYKNLSAELTMAKGKYDGNGGFRGSIKDREAQARLYSQDRVVKTEDYRVSAVREARKALAQDPDLSKNIFYLAEVLSDLETDEAENEAIQLLENTYQARSDFSFKRRAGLFKIKQLRRKTKAARAALEAKPDDAQAKAAAEELSVQLNKVELEHYLLCVKNYPTDMKAKYEYGVRLIRNKRYDEAIPLFQEAKKDPRQKIAAMDKTGYCFFMKGWYSDAIDVFTQAIDSYEIKDDAVGKELRYNLARAYEGQGETEKALEIYRKVAQLDFSYKDVSRRVDKLRGTQNQK